MVMPCRLTKIYTLICPITSDVKYIGKTIKPLDKRLSEHKSDLRGNNKRKNWIRKLAKIGLQPEIALVEEVDSDWEFWERYWICQFRAWGFDLKNQTAGGEGATGRVVSPEVRKRISDSQKGRKRNPQQIANAVNGRMARSGYVSTVEQRKKQSEKLKGKPKTELHRMKAAEASRGVGWNEAAKLKMSRAKQGIRVRHLLKPVVAVLSTGEAVYFECVRDGARYFNIKETSISNCLKGRSKTSGGITWKYLSKSAH